jgi:NADH:ubiquinone oxidoreductase subunit D
VVVKVEVEPGAEVPSITDLWTGAGPLEREVYDLFGVRFSGHPDLTRIVLRDDFVGHPLLKSFEMDRAGVSAETSVTASESDGERHGFHPSHEGEDPSRSERLVLHMGPQHPSMHGVLHVWLELEGEVVVDSKPTQGYLHRCIEKVCELRSYKACIALMDRADYVSGFHTELAYLLALEELAGIEVTPRGQYLRVLFSEICRITSHQTWLTAAGLDVGALTPFLYAFHYRERMADIYEAVTGSRMMFNYFRPGGVKADLPDGVAEQIEEILTTFDAQVDEYEALLTNNEIFRARTRGVGVIEPETILDYCVTGPMARASGIDIDLRRDEPYAAYGELDVETPLGEVGDTYDRYTVRVAEMRASARIALQALHAMPEGPFVNPDVPRVLRPPAGSAYRRVESPRGELGVLLVSQGETSPWRLKIRSPAMSNLHVLPAVLPGCQMGDVVAVTGSVDVVMGEIDR